MPTPTLPARPSQPASAILFVAPQGLQTCERLFRILVGGPITLDLQEAVVSAGPLLKAPVDEN